MRIYLIGYMGCGKSTLGRELAKNLNLQFIDLDHYIESRNCKSVASIFADRGEDGFRKLEQSALREVADIENVVIATGGGAPCFFNNMELMNETGTTIYLDASPKLLADRLSKSKTVRPLIQGKAKDELIDFITETLEKRGLFYKKAKTVITHNDNNLTAIDIQKLI